MDPHEQPEQDELTEAQCAELRSDLVSLQAELERHINVGSESAETVDLDAPIGRLTRMDAMQRQQMAAETLRRQSVRLAQVRAAIKRIDTTDLFGLCQRCEEPIGMRRLSARPEAPICMTCQRAQETRR
ncbi:MAG: TraR/DksA C4-type zinc finger protein [Myxococcales bacterium]|nr:TraR/DksA C4-type zinc finger protein [Myxococcales bacterium]